MKLGALLAPATAFLRLFRLGCEVFPGRKKKKKSVRRYSPRNQIKREYQMAFCLAFACFAGSAHACEISTDAELYDTRKEQSILLMQYGDVVLRAADGKIRCEEDDVHNRLVCMVGGPGEMLVDGGTETSVVRMSDATSYKIHVSPSGDLGCAESQRQNN